MACCFFLFLPCFFQHLFCLPCFLQLFFCFLQFFQMFILFKRNRCFREFLYLIPFSSFCSTPYLSLYNKFVNTIAFQTDKIRSRIIPG